jgi:hypothetical protein
MVYLVHTQNRPFSYRDFLVFEIEGKEYRIAHGTFRNKILGLERRVELREYITQGRPSTPLRARCLETR